MPTVLLLNLGGPGGAGDVYPFLRNLFSDPKIIELPGGRLFQPAFARLLAGFRAPRVRGLYALIGGGSPLLPMTKRQAAALAAELSRRGHRDTRVEVVMRYTEPGAAAACRELARAGEKRAIALPLYPQECVATTGSSLSDLEAARDRHAPGLEIVAIKGYHDHPGYLDAFGARIRETLDALPEGPRAEAVLLFSAHAVPEKLPRRGDPYVDQIRATVAGLLARLGGTNEHRLGFQSRVGPVRWVGPGTDEVIESLRGRGTVVVVPISFVSDHIETLYEIDLLFGEQARRAGIQRFVRVAALDDSPLFVGALADLAEPYLNGAA
jgi:ferrochelatase